MSIGERQWRRLLKSWFPTRPRAVSMASAVAIPRPRWRSCAAPCKSSTRWPRSAPGGVGGPWNSFEIMKAYIAAGAAGVHFEDQLASEKKCGHMGGKVLIPTAAHERNLIAARLAADVCGTSTFVLARTDAESAKLITADVDERDREFITGERTPEGVYS